MRDILHLDEKNTWWKHSDTLEQLCNHIETDLGDMDETAPGLKSAAETALRELDFIRQRLNAAITQVDTIVPHVDVGVLPTQPESPIITALRPWALLDSIDEVDDIPF